MHNEAEHVDVWDYAECVSTTQHPTHCPTCGQECAPADLRGNLWHELVKFTSSAIEEGEGTTVDVLSLFAKREQSWPVEVRAYINQRSTYRVQKNLLARCVGRGIPLLRANGKPRAKTDLERELACSLRRMN